MQLTVYDGADTIGGNKILLEDRGVNLFFDFGPRNLERLLTFGDIAKDCGRRHVLTSGMISVTINAMWQEIGCPLRYGQDL